MNLSCHCEPQPQSGRFGAWQSQVGILFYLCLSVFICGANEVFADSIPVPTITPTPGLTATPVLTPTATVLPPAQTPSANIKGLPRITVIPNPAWGTKATFRIMTAVPSKVKIRVYNRFFDVVAKFNKEGNGLFDILWSLKDVSEGIYHFQAQIENTATGQITQLPLQKFVVEK